MILSFETVNKDDAKLREIAFKIRDKGGNEIEF
jgi:hypothetical protein